MIDVVAADHEHAQVVCRAFAKGCGGRLCKPGEETSEEIALYGILRGTGEIIKRRAEEGRGFWYIDHGYIRPGHYSGYYRIVRSALHTNLRARSDHGRLLGLHWTPDREHRALRYSPVLLAPPSEYVCKHFGKSRDEWIEIVRAKVRKVSDRPIAITSKDEDPGVPKLSQCWCLVTLQSNLAIEAIRKGVPVFVEHGNFPDEWSHPAEYFADDLKNIDDPFRPTVADRFLWGAHLAATQFTLVEMASGHAFRYLQRAHELQSADPKTDPVPPRS